MSNVVSIWGIYKMTPRYLGSFCLKKVEEISQITTRDLTCYVGISSIQSRFIVIITYFTRQSSVRNGDAGKLLLLYKLQFGLAAQP